MELKGEPSHAYVLARLLRTIANAMFHRAEGGCAWRLSPRVSRPGAQSYGWFTRRRDGCVVEAINHPLVRRDRERCGREVSPTAGVIDSQNINTTESSGPRGDDTGKQIKARKRHTMVDTRAPGLRLNNHPASVQNRDGTPPLSRNSRYRWPMVQPAVTDKR